MKKVFLSLLFVLLGLGLVGCNFNVTPVDEKPKETEVKETEGGKTEPQPTVDPTKTETQPAGYDFETVFNKVVNLVSKDGVKDNINLPAAVGSVAFIWSSSDETICSKTGVITRGLEDREVTLTALMIYGTEQATMSFTIRVLKTEETIDKISDVLNADLSQGTLPSFTVNGTVIGVSGGSFLIQDETGMILVYRGYTWTHELVIGDKVLVSGTPTTYSDTVQFDANATYTKVGTDDSYVTPTPKEVSGSDLDGYVEELKHDYVQVTGTLAISGNYYNLSVAGATVKGSIVSPLVSDIDSMNGKEVTVTGYVLYLTGKGAYLNILATSVEGDTTPIEKETKTISEILQLGEGVYETEATVCATNAQSFLLTDGTSYLLAYRGRSWSGDLEQGDTVTISGNVTTYNGSLQFDSSATYVKGEPTTYVLPTPKELTAAECDAFKDNCPVTFAKVTGKLAISGNYYNLTIEGAEIIGSIAYPKEDISGLDGKLIEVTGFVLYTTGSGRYLNFMATSIEEGKEPTPGPIEAKTVTEIIAASLGSYETTGTVCAINKQSFLLTDGTSYILCYQGKDWVIDVEVGDSVAISGEVATYSDTKQFAAGATYTVTKKTSEYVYGTPKELTATDCDAFLKGVTVQYASVVGKLAISGNYVNLTIPQASVTGSVAYPIDDLSGFDGKFVKVTGYVLYVNGSSTKYLNFMATAIEETEEPVIEIKEVTVTDIVNGANGEYETTATVSAIYAQGFLVTDGTNHIIVYRGRSWQCDLEVGDEVTLKGNVELYYGGKEFKSDATYQKTGNKNEVTLGDAAVKLGEFFTEVVTQEQIICEYIEFDGLLVVNADKYNIKINDTLVTGSLIYPVEDYSGLADKYVKVKGFACYTDGGSKFLNVVALSIVETEGEYIEPTIEIPDDATEGRDFDFEGTFDLYNGGWTNSYTFREIKTYEMNYKEQYTIQLSNANKQSSTITTMPVCASKNTDQYITIIGDFSDATKVTFSLVQWREKTFAYMYLEYTLDGTTWVKCSEEITVPGELVTNVSIANALQVRLVFNGGATGNIQVGLQKITIE